MCLLLKIFNNYIQHNPGFCRGFLLFMQPLGRL